MPPAPKADAEDALKAEYDRGYADAMAQPLDPEEPALKDLAQKAYDKGYAEGLEAGKPKPPPFEQAKAHVRTLVDLDANRLEHALAEWQAEHDVKLNSSDVNLLKTLHSRLRENRRARAIADAEMRPVYSTVGTEPAQIETQYEAVN